MADARANAPAPIPFAQAEPSGAQIFDDSQAITPAAEPAVDALPPRAQDRYIDLRTAAAADAAINTWSSIERQRGRYEEAKASLGHYREQHGPAADAKQIAKMEAAINRERATLKAVQDESRRRTAEGIELRELTREVERFVIKAFKRGDVLKDATIDVPDGATVAGQRHRIAELRDERDAVKRAWPELDQVLARERGKFDERVVRGAPAVHVGVVDRGRHLREHLEHVVEVEWPLARLDAAAMATHASEPPTVLDVEAIVTSLFPDQIWSKIESAIKAAYRKHKGLVMSADDQRRRLAEIDHEILDAEYIEASLAWATGEPVGWRRDISPRALLGIV
jgi:hypothetical protein